MADERAHRKRRPVRYAALLSPTQTDRHSGWDNADIQRAVQKSLAAAKASKPGGERPRSNGALAAAASRPWNKLLAKLRVTLNKLSFAKLALQSHMAERKGWSAAMPAGADDASAHLHQPPPASTAVMDAQADVAKFRRMAAEVLRALESCDVSQGDSAAAAALPDPATTACLAAAHGGAPAAAGGSQPTPSCSSAASELQCPPQSAAPAATSTVGAPCGHAGSAPPRDDAAATRKAASASPHATGSGGNRDNGEDGEGDDHDDEDDVVCVRCGSGEEDEDVNPILLCDHEGCDRGWHRMCLESPLPMEEVEDEDAEWVCDHCCALAEALAIVIETDTDVDAESVAELASALEAAAAAVDPLGGPAAVAEPDLSDPVTGMRLAAIAAAEARSVSPGRAASGSAGSSNLGASGTPAGRAGTGSSRKRRRSSSSAGKGGGKSGRRAPKVDYAMLNALMFEGTSPSARSRSAGTSDDEFVGTLREEGAPSTDSDDSSDDDSSDDDSSDDDSDDDDDDEAGDAEAEGRGGARAAASKARSLISAEVVAAPAAADSSEDDEDFEGGSGTESEEQDATGAEADDSDASSES